jgi:hypothetical protein
MRGRQREVREKNVFSIRGMLEDMVQNRLDVVLYPGTGGAEDWRGAAQRAVWEIQARLNFIEAESLRAESATEPGAGIEGVAGCDQAPNVT